MGGALLDRPLLFLAKVNGKGWLIISICADRIPHTVFSSEAHLRRDLMQRFETSLQRQIEKAYRNYHRALR